ncbi:hypothetical protein DEA8626_02207 [Defluviimonas aquaemixtae]|uniref:Uncharacterized protein n=1 Tax=Albidovulum aquaemixtae TaxID=1542388 RepID=A0A2R8B7P9_9RHOB|nr:hypothetical protein [Defluviimonas aquaemixtae]SPH18665.1 hypothetical protein DEA8626_02207 [Defluviimonas aquaemixtae]
MPALIRLYICNVLIGFALSGVFVASLLWLNVANLWHLISTSPEGWIAALMLFVFNGIVFAGVQFSIVVMRMEQKDEDPPKGPRLPASVSVLAPVRISSPVRARR